MENEDFGRNNKKEPGKEFYVERERRKLRSDNRRQRDRTRPTVETEWYQNINGDQFQIYLPKVGFSFYICSGKTSESLDD